MSLRDFFSRSKVVSNILKSQAKTQHSENEITCDTMELKTLITEWTRNEDWEFEEFADFLQLVGVKTPVKLSELDEKKHSFKCVTALGTEIHISLLFGDWFDFCSEIRVTEGEETRRYNTNTNRKKGKTLPKVTLQSRNIKRTGKELESYYCEYFCNRILKIDDTHVLKVEIDEPDKYKEKSEIFVLRNCVDIEEYLLGLDNSLVVSEVYEKIVKFLNFSNEDISKCGKILISYIEIINKEEMVREKLFLTNGKSVK